MLYSERIIPILNNAMNGKAIAGIVAVLAVAGSLWWYFDNRIPSTTPMDTETGSPAATSTNTGTNSPAGGSTSPAGAIIVTHSNQGYSPATVTVPVGGTVTFVNESSQEMWVGADQHPTHTEYDGTSRAEHCAESYTGPSPFDSCKRIPAGGSWSFRFTKAGTFDYHDHLDASKQSRIIVSGTGASTNLNVSVE